MGNTLANHLPHKKKYCLLVFSLVTMILSKNQLAPIPIGRFTYRDVSITFVVMSDSELGEVTEIDQFDSKVIRLVTFEAISGLVEELLA
jgi:hypothetical protein